MAIQSSVKPISKRFSISRKEFEDFRSIQLRPRTNWWAVFSVNPKEQVWPFVCFGYTPEDKRKYVLLEDYPLLKKIAGYIVEKYPEGGRLFINEKGVFCIKGEIEKRGIAPKHEITWIPDEPLLPIESAEDLRSKREEMMREIKANRTARGKHN